MFAELKLIINQSQDLNLRLPAYPSFLLTSITEASDKFIAIIGTY